MMKLLNKLTITLFALGIIFASCDTLIYDNLEDCPQGVYVKFFSMTPCDTDSSFIGDVSSLTLFAFDKNDKLVITTTKTDVTLSRDYDILVPVSNGEFSFIAWAGLNDDFTLGTFTPGTTTKQDVMMTLKTAADKAANIDGTKVWQGQNSGTVYLPEPSEWASVYEYTAVNLHEVTNRINLIIDFDPDFLPVTTDDLEVTLTSDNGTMLINGAVASGNPVIEYPGYNLTNGKSTISYDFTLLDLVQGNTNNLRVYYPGTDQVIFDGDFVKDLILNTEGSINLACENDFTIRMNLKGLETNMSVGIWVNNWKVHSYEWEG